MKVKEQVSTINGKTGREKRATVFILQHVRPLDEDCKDVKLIGIYSSKTMAHKAKLRSARLPGFRETGKFSIDAYEVDRDHWTTGFVTMKARSG